MAKFGGFPLEFKSLGYGKLKKWNEAHGFKCPEADFDKEAKKIGLEPPKKKAPKE
jgi:hypothetical protein